MNCAPSPAHIKRRNQTAMKTIAASIVMLLLVLIGGILITRKPRHSQQVVSVIERATETQTEMSSERGASPDGEEELPEYYQVIIDNNLFLPLGWKMEVKSDVPFQLVGTVLTDALGYYQAVLKSVDTQRVYFMTLNEVQDGWRLVMIEPKRVILEKDDLRITLALNEQHLFINRLPRRFSHETENTN